MNERDIETWITRGGRGRHISFEEIIDIKNLFFAWNEFKRGKQQKRDVQEFALDVEDRLFELYDDLMQGTYVHSPYTSFYVRDPKLRHIHKPAVRDRVLHHALVHAIEPLFERYFIFNSYSSRKGKGTHAAVLRLRRLAWGMSKNNTKTVRVLHVDVRKYFDSVDHDILLRLIKRRVYDEKIVELIEKIVRSYHTQPGKGIPLGNLTSQLFSNVYLHELDQCITRAYGFQYYIRYADDIVVIARNKIFLESVTTLIQNFLEDKLSLTLHPRKTVLRKWHQGIDFLGYVSFPYYTILRTKTKRRLLKRLKMKHEKLKQGLIGSESFEQSAHSYAGMLTHCYGFGIKTSIRKIKGGDRACELDERIRRVKRRYNDYRPPTNRQTPHHRVYLWVLWTTLLKYAIW